MYAVLAELVEVFKITEKHVGIKVTSFNKITKLTKYNQFRIQNNLPCPLKNMIF